MVQAVWDLPVRKVSVIPWFSRSKFQCHWTGRRPEGSEGSQAWRSLPSLAGLRAIRVSHGWGGGEDAWHPERGRATVFRPNKQDLGRTGRYRLEHSCFEG